MAFDHDELGPLFDAADTLMIPPTAPMIEERAAGKVPAKLEKEYMALTGHPISEGYGMTESALPRASADGGG